MAVLGQTFDAKSANLFSSGIPELVLINGTNFPLSGYAFDDTTIEQICFNFNSMYYLSGNLTVTVEWYSRSGSTTGNVVWGVQLAAVGTGDAQSLETKAFASASSATSAVNSTAKGLRDAVITATNTDSMVASDWVQARIFRDASNVSDTMAGDAIVTLVKFEYASTAGAGSGNVSNAGSSTDNAVARWDGTTGQVLQDSVVTIADSTGNMAGVGTLNGRTIANWVDGPASVTGGDLASFNGATGKLVQDSGIAAANVMTAGSNFAAAGNILTAAGTAKVAQDSGVALTSLPQISGTFATGDVLSWNGSVFVPKYRGSASTSGTQSVTTTVANLTGAVLALPRAGRYLITGVVPYLTGGTTAGVMQIAFSYSGTTTSYSMQAYSFWTVNSGAFGNSSALATAVPTGTSTAFTSGVVLNVVFAGVIVVSTAGNLQLRVVRVSGPTITAQAGAGLEACETS